jgi:AAA domain-containing protein/DnaB helicase-like protein
MVISCPGEASKHFRAMPHEDEAELMLLRYLARFPSELERVERIIHHTHYRLHAHRILHRGLAEVGDPTLLASWLERHRLMDEIGGPEYLGQLFENQPSAFEPHAELVRESYRRREIREAGYELIRYADDRGADITQAMSFTESRFDALRSGSSGEIERFLLGDIWDQYPKLRPCVIDGVAREGETINLISMTKIGKSWLSYYLSLCIMSGIPWFGRFQTSMGRILLIDNELHKETISYRIREVATAMGVPHEKCRDMMEVWPLRGRLRDIYAIGPQLRKAKGFKVIIIDAKYRMMAAGKSENDNNAETMFYNALDAYAEATGAAICVIHHASKGDQSSKSVIDVGSGAGAQSRAADCHLVLREHEDNGACVFDGKVRSFAPIEPFSLRWTFPLWALADDLDPTKLRGRLSNQEIKQKAKDAEGIGMIIDVLMVGPATERQIRDKTGMSKDRAAKLLSILLRDNRITPKDVIVKGNETVEYHLNGQEY